MCRPVWEVFLDIDPQPFLGCAIIWRFPYSSWEIWTKTGGLGYPCILECWTCRSLDSCTKTECFMPCVTRISTMLVAPKWRFSMQWNWWNDVVAAATAYILLVILMMQILFGKNTDSSKRHAMSHQRRRTFPWALRQRFSTFSVVSASTLTPEIIDPESWPGSKVVTSINRFITGNQGLKSKIEQDEQKLKTIKILQGTKQ